MRALWPLFSRESFARAFAQNTAFTFTLLLQLLFNTTRTLPGPPSTGATAAAVQHNAHHLRTPKHEGRYRYGRRCDRRAPSTTTHRRKDGGTTQRDRPTQQVVSLRHDSVSLRRKNRLSEAGKSDSLRQKRRKSDSLRQKFGSVSQKYPDICLSEAGTESDFWLSEPDFCLSETRNTPHCTFQ